MCTLLLMCLRRASCEVKAGTLPQIVGMGCRQRSVTYPPLVGHLLVTYRPLKPTVMTLSLCDFQHKPVVSGGKRHVTGEWPMSDRSLPTTHSDNDAILTCWGCVPVSLALTIYVTFRMVQTSSSTCLLLHCRRRSGCRPLTVNNDVDQFPQQPHKRTLP